MALAIRVFVAIFSVSYLACNTHAQLSPFFYSRSCPNLQTTVRIAMKQAILKEPRLGASILRLFFHDCFVNGCDASILLDDTATVTGEKNAFPNQNSLRGFEVIDSIKSKVEATCSDTVSCADILAIAARDAVFLLGGPSWSVPLGRRDARTASQSAANSNLPPSFANLSTLISLFAAQGLSARDMTALSGAHTIGQAKCLTFRAHIYNDSNVDPTFATTRMATCPPTLGTGTVTWPQLIFGHQTGLIMATFKTWWLNVDFFTQTRNCSTVGLKMGLLDSTVLTMWLLQTTLLVL